MDNTENSRIVYEASVNALGRRIRSDSRARAAYPLPFEFRFSVSAQDTFDAIARHSGNAPLPPSELYRVLALQLEWTSDHNLRKIRRLLWALELAILFLAVEVAAWIVVLWRT